MTTPRTQRATLTDVAKQAGVSRMTVSNAYNRPDVVAPSTRKRVLAAAALLDYGGPSAVGRTLRRGTTEVLGLLTRVGLQDSFADPAAAQFMRGVAQGCEEADLSLQIVHATGPSAVERVRDAAVDAFVAWSLGTHDPALPAALARRLPVVSFGGTDALAESPYVSSDNHGGAVSAADHLLDQGVDRIAVLTCHVETKEFADRVAGWRQALESAGIDWADVVTIDVPASAREHGRDAARELLADLRSGGRWGVLATTDVIALGFIQTVIGAGLDVPGDVAVVGFDDIEEAAASTPALTTVHQDMIGLGRECALRAAGMMEEPTAVRPATLVVRASTDPRLSTRRES